MAWNAEQSNKDMLEAQEQIQIQLKVVKDRTPAAVLQLPNAQQDVDKAKQTVESLHERMRRTINSVQSAIDSMSSKTAGIRATIESKRNKVADLDKSVSEAQTLADIRKEQAEALKQKYDATYHSSWLGLWRPLSDSSRVGVLISSIAFGLIAVCSILFYFWENIVKYFPGQPSQTETTNESLGFFGVGGKRLRRK
jgi:hypothetical protein